MAGDRDRNRAAAEAQASTKLTSVVAPTLTVADDSLAACMGTLAAGAMLRFFDSRVPVGGPVHQLLKGGDGSAVGADGPALVMLVASALPSSYSDVPREALDKMKALTKKFGDALRSFFGGRRKSAR